MSKEELVLVAGAGGFIGGHLVSALRAEGYENIRAVDQKPLADWYQTFDDVENLTLDLKEREACRIAAKNAAIYDQLVAGQAVHVSA